MATADSSAAIAAAGAAVRMRERAAPPVAKIFAIRFAAEIKFHFVILLSGLLSASSARKASDRAQCEYELSTVNMTAWVHNMTQPLTDSDSKRDEWLGLADEVADAPFVRCLSWRDDQLSGILSIQFRGNDLPRVVCILSTVLILISVQVLCFATCPKEQRRSDIGLCFHLNRCYHSRAVRGLRLAAVLGIVLLISISLALHATAAAAITLVTEQLYRYWVLNLVALYKLMGPSSIIDPRTARWAEYKRVIGEPRERRPPFSHILTSAGPLVDRMASEAALAAWRDEEANRVLYEQSERSQASQENKVAEMLCA